MKAQWTVRLILHPDEPRTLPLLWVEQLRYLGYVRVLSEDETRTVVEFRCPHARGTDTKIWAEQNAERMRSFGIDAAAAPEWKG